MAKRVAKRVKEKEMMVGKRDMMSEKTVEKRVAKRERKVKKAKSTRTISSLPQRRRQPRQCVHRVTKSKERCALTSRKQVDVQKEHSVRTFTQILTRVKGDVSTVALLTTAKANALIPLQDWWSRNQLTRTSRKRTRRTVAVQMVLAVMKLKTCVKH